MKYLKKCYTPMTRLVHPTSKDWDGFDWAQAQYHERNVSALEEYREMPPTSTRGLRINAELRTTGKMSLAGRALLVSVKRGFIHSRSPKSLPLQNLLLLRQSITS